MKRTLAESKKQRTKNSRHRQVWKDALMNEQKRIIQRLLKLWLNFIISSKISLTSLDLAS